MQRPTAPAVRAALLIDADNFHHPDQLLAVQAQFSQHMGKHFICHAHGSAQVLSREALKPVWQALAARLMPALPLSKNTTDTELVMDALLLHFHHGVTRFGIASGDADFAPLSLQLRELGCEVWCFARMAIAFEHMPSYYDRVVRFDRLPVDSAAPPPAPKPVPPAKLAPALRPEPQSVDAAASSATTLVQTVAVKVPAFVVNGVSLARILQACPALATGLPQHLNTTVHTLRQKGVLGAGTKALTWFAQFGDAFKVISTPGVTATVCWQAKQPATTQKLVTVETEKSKPLQPTIAASASSAAVATTPLAWPVSIPRRNAQPLRSLELHALRKVLIQLAAKRATTEHILQAVPELATGRACVLGSVAGRLRERRMLHESRSALDVLSQHTEFEVSLKTAPQTVRYRG